MKIFITPSPHRFTGAMTALLVAVLALWCSTNPVGAQTTLLSSTGDGGFENGSTFAANNWTAVNSSTDAWVVGSVPVVSAGTNCGYISSNGGAAWTYSQLSVIQHLYYTVTLPAGESKATISFKWKAGGEGTTTSDWDNLKVFFGPSASITPTANTAISSTYQVSGSGATSGMYKLSSASYNTETITVLGTPGTTYKLVFSWKSDVSTIANPPASIDEVSVVSSTPGNFVSAATGNWSAGATWVGGVAPSAADNATVSTGHTVTLDVATPSIYDLTVSGTLAYATTATSFTVKNNLTVSSGGIVNVFNSTTGKTLNVAGNLTNNGTVDISVGSTSAGTLVLNGTSVQTVSGTGTFNTGVIRNLTCSNTSTAIPNIVWSFNNIKIAYNLSLTGARIDLGTNKMVFGNSAAGNTLTAPSGTGFLTGGRFSRWWTTAATGTTVTAGTDPSNTTSRYPFVTSTGVDRSMYISRTGSTTGNVAGELSAQYTHATGMTTGLSLADGAYTVTDRFNGTWTVSTESTGYVHAGAHTVVILAPTAFVPANGNTRIMNVSSFVGTHQNGTVTPGAQRTGITTAQLTAGALYLGVAAADVPFVPVASGDWNNAATWNKGTAPTCSDVVTITSGFSVTVNSAGNVCQKLTINSGGTLTVSSGDLTVGCTLNNNTLSNSGTLTVTGGTLNINGNLVCASASTFNQSGGSIVVDGNAAGVTANSVATGTYLISITASAVANLNLTGGSITIVDPHAGASTSDYCLYISQGGAYNSASTGHTVNFGDGVSTTSGGHSNGFYYYLFPGSYYYGLGNVVVNTLTGTNRTVKHNTTYSSAIAGNLTITSGEFINATSTYIAGNITNNGTLTATSTIYLGSFNGSGGVSTSAQSIGGSGTFRNLSASPTASFTNLTVNNTNATGITLNVPLSVSGTLTMTSGLINTTSTNLLTLGTATAAGTLSGTPGSTNMIVGPFARTFAASTTGSSTFSSTHLYPVGKGSTYQPIWVSPTTTSGGAVVFTGEAFLTNSGSAAAGVTNLSSATWSAIPNATTNLTNVFVQVGESGIVTGKQILHASSAAGSYGATPVGITYTAGTPPTLKTSSGIVTASYYGYFAYGDITPCTTPTDQPTVFTTANMTTTTFTGSYTAAASAPSNYLVVRYASGATPTAPSDYTAYTVGATLGTGSVRYIGTGTSFSETGLSAGTTYDYYVYSYNNAGCFGPIYNVSSPLMASVTTCATTTGTPGTPTSGSITTTSFTATWTASSTSGVDYIIDVATDAGFTSFVSGYNALNVGTALTTNVTGLSGGTTYYVRVRAVITGCFSANSPSLTVATECNPETAPTTTQAFTTYVPACWKEAAGTLAAPTTFTSTTTSAWGASTGFANTGSNPGVKINLYGTKNDWVISQPIDLGGTAGVYRIKYSMAVTSYNGTTAQSTLSTHKVDIVVSTDGGATWSSANVVKTYTGAGSYSNTGQTEYIDLTAYSGVVKIAFVATTTSTSPDIDFHIDDFQVEAIPSCSGTPTGGTISSSISSACGATNSGTLTSTANSYSTGLGITYQWEKSTDNFVSDIQNISGATNPVTAGTGTFVSGNNYYRLKVTCTNSGLSGYSNVVTVAYANPAVLTSSGASRCGTGTVTLSATTDPGNTLNWYAAASGGSPLGTGTSFTTPSISTTTTYYVGASAGGTTFNVGLASDAAANLGSFSAYGMYFSTTDAVTINSVKIYPSTAGTLTVSLKNGSGTVIDSRAFTIASGEISTTTQKTLSLGFSVPAGSTGWQLYYDIAINRGGGTYSYPYTSNGFSITGNTLDGNNITGGTRYYLYDWNVSTGCNGTRTAVTATINTPPTITPAAAPAIICEGETSFLSASSSNSGYSYAWSGGSASVMPTATTTYTVTATDASGGAYDGCVTTGTITITVNKLPVISVSPTSATICNGAVQQLTGVNSNNLTVGTGTSTNATTGYPSPFSNYYGGAKHQMIILASELSALGMSSGADITSITFDVTAVGSTFSGSLSSFTVDMGLTATSSLGSSSFLSGLTNVRASASLAIPTSGLPQTVTIPITPFQWNGTSNIVIQTSYSNANSGTSTDYVQMQNSDPGFSSTNWYRADGATASTILSAATPSGSGNARPNMVLGWSTSGLTWLWSPTTALYTDMAATAAYTNQNTATVYAKPSATTTYTLSATSAQGCISSVMTTVTVDPPSVGGTVSAASTCHPTSTNSGTLTLAGHTGNVVRWESASDAAFTTPTTIVNTTTSYSYSNVAATTYYRAVVQSGSCAEAYSSTAEVQIGCSATLNLTAFIEGFMDGSTMRPAKMNSGIGMSSTDCDDITVELHNSGSPYALAETFTGTLQVDGTLACTFPATVVGNSYYIVVKHRNAMETWSASPVTFASSNSYDFSSGSAQAYGGNMIQVGSKWCFYSGDINGAQDGVIDPSDYILWEADNNNFAYGYYPTDLNGDGSVDPSDYTIWETNNNLFIFVITP